jgi:hypothetical protein
MANIVEWEEVYTTFNFYRATNRCKSKWLMPLNLLRNLKEITGDETIDISKTKQKLINFKYMAPPCSNADGGSCSNKYKEGSLYTDPFDEWEREEICDECDNTEICLCGQIFRERHYIWHEPTGKICCVGVCCVEKIDHELGNLMRRGECYECHKVLHDKTQAYQKLGFCTLECLEVQNPTHELLERCKYPGCRIFLYPLDYRLKYYCAKLCKTKHKELIKALKKLEKKKEQDELEESKRQSEIIRKEKEAKLKAIREARFEAERKLRKETELEQRRVQEEYKRNLMDPSVTLLCDCEKYYIPYEWRIKCKDPICLVCKTKKRNEPITHSLLRWMAEHDLVHALTLEDVN